MDKNKKDRSFDQQYKSIEQLIREAYGLSPDQMEKRMDWAEAEAASEAPLGGRNIPKASEHEFQTILSKMEARGITPRVMADFSREQQRVLQSENGFLAAQKAWLTINPTPEVKSRRFRNRHGEKDTSKRRFMSSPFHAAGAAAACAAVGIAVFTLRPGIDVMGKRNYTYVSEVRDGEKTDIVWNNQENYISSGEGKLEQAYKKIKEELGMPVLKVNYMPLGMKFSGLTIENGHARLELDYKDNYVYVLQIYYSKGNSDANFSDSEEYTHIYNEWLNLNIPVRKVAVTDTEFEYYAYLEKGGAHYYIQGIMEEEDFFTIVENLSIEL